MNKKNLILGALLALTVLMPVKSRATEAANGAPSPAGFGGVTDTLNYQGIKPIRMAGSTGILLHAGAGFLDAVCPFLGTAGQYTMLYDEADGVGVNLGAGLTNSAALTYSLTPQVYTAGNTASTATGQYSLLPGQAGCWVPPAPIKFVNGLYGAGSSTGHETLVFAHCSTGANPCSMP